MKTLTRFLESEINGKYAISFYRSIGALTRQSEQWAGYLRKMTFESMEREELNALCKLLGVYNPVVEADGFDTFLTLPQSGTALFKDMSSLQWKAITTTEGEEANEQATSSNRTGLAEPNATVKGYIPYDVNAYDSYGNVDESKVSRTPPSKPYSEYYGDKYLYLASSSFVLAFLSDAELRSYLKLMMRLRNVGATWQGFLDVCDFLNIGEVLSLSWGTPPVSAPWVKELEYEVKSGNFTNRAKRVSLFLNIIRLKFPQIHLEAKN